MDRSKKVVRENFYSQHNYYHSALRHYAYICSDTGDFSKYLLIIHFNVVKKSCFSFMLTPLYSGEPVGWRGCQIVDFQPRFPETNCWWWLVRLGRWWSGGPCPKSRGRGCRSLGRERACWNPHTHTHTYGGSCLSRSFIQYTCHMCVRVINPYRYTFPQKSKAPRRPPPPRQNMSFWLQIDDYTRPNQQLVCRISTYMASTVWNCHKFDYCWFVEAFFDSQI